MYLDDDNEVENVKLESSTVFKKLVRLGIPFAVCASTVKMRGVNNIAGKDWFIIAPITAMGDQLSSLRFTCRGSVHDPVGDNHPKVCERTMRGWDIAFFKKHKKHFVMKHNGRSGFVYEYRKNPLKRAVAVI